MSATPNLQLPSLDANQNQKHVTHNDALLVLDALVGCTVVGTTIGAPPPSPGDGQRWIVPAGATGAWAGKATDIAAWQDGAWSFFAPKPGFTAYAQDLAALLVWSGTAWGAVASGGGGGTAGPAAGFVQALIFG